LTHKCEELSLNLQSQCELGHHVCLHATMLTTIIMDQTSEL
jgi:hypothetical protein